MPKNFRSIPQAIQNRITQLGVEEFRVGVVKRIPLTEIQLGLWRHACIEIVDGQLTHKQSYYPHVDNGRASKFNMQGDTIIRKDLPKEPRDINMGPRPVYGDWGKGSFDLTITRDCYRREQVPAPRTAIDVQMLPTEEVEFGVCVVFFSITSRHRPSLLDTNTLLHEINLIQENFNQVDVLDADASNDELLSRIYVNWQLLPPGERDAGLARILNIYRPRTPEERQVLVERYQTLAEYEPSRWIVGTHSFAGYFGAIVGERVVLENMREGNALYTMGADEWMEHSRHSRTELLHYYGNRVQRIVHTPGWQTRLRQIIGHNGG